MSHLHCGHMDFAHQSGKTGLPFGHCRSRTPPVHPVVICVHQIVTACIVGPPNMAPFPDARRYTGHEGHTARGSALHHTAVLLTRQGEAAEDFVQIALAKAWQSWGRIHGNHEAYVRRMMVNEFASAWRRRGAASCPPALPGRALSVPMTCTPSGNPKGNLILINDWFTRMVANFTGPGRTGIAMCAITGGHFCEPIGVATDTNTTVAADVSLTTGSGPSLAPPRPRRFMRLSTRACPGEAIPAHHAPQARTPPSGRVRWPFRTWVRQRRANANQALAASCPYDPKRNLNLEVAGLAGCGCSSTASTSATRSSCSRCATAPSTTGTAAGEAAPSRSTPPSLFSPAAVPARRPSRREGAVGDHPAGLHQPGLACYPPAQSGLSRPRLLLPVLSPGRIRPGHRQTRAGRRTREATPPPQHRPLRTRQRSKHLRGE